ncbi:MAG: nucleotidyl transferase AbiEii/AbiGii toxin family protein [Syntrophobacteraceae bacterium]|nr:nucleotidyl transferase AbiEii/AbiGii toxin family protein [Syntrophobacteraceae bacterium]
MKPARNVAASVRQRLLNRAKREKRPFNELLQYYAMERFLYRLSRSAHADCFILKGALMLRVWRSPEFRPTMDIDLLGKTGNDEAGIVEQIRDVIAVVVEPDGLAFDPDSIQSERITEDADYAGIRVRLRGMLDSARVSVQIDIGFGDIVYPGPEESDLPTMLDLPAPRLLYYSRESAIAEKFEAIVKLGVLNSRMKDFYDIWLLSRQFNFDGAKLVEAIRLTFERRGTVLSADIETFNKTFIDSKQVQWTAFWKRLQHDHIPALFNDIVSALETFLSPPASELSQGNLKLASWTAPGPWS